ncbi:MAG: M14 family zinc carboxypeptidase [Acidobacteriota bacterium]
MPFSPRFARLLLLALAIPLPLLADGAAPSAGFVAVPPVPGDGPWVVRAHFSTGEQVDAVAAFVEPWEVRRRDGFLVADVDRDDIERMLKLGLFVEIDVARTERMLRAQAPLPGQVMGIPGFPCYRTVEETFASAVAITQAHPTLAQWIDAGDSWVKTQFPGTGYDLFVLRLTNQAIVEPKPVLYVNAAIHAREYATAELVTRFAELLVASYGTDAEITELLDHSEIHVLLQSNPDGRKQAESGIYWRKNADDNFCTGSDYRGIDLNRNFEYNWGCCGGSSSAECDETFRGPSAASEPETQAVEAYVRSVIPDQWDPPDPKAPDDAVGLFMDIHSYGEWVLWPWGYTSTVAPNGVQMQTLGRKFAFSNNYFPMQAIDLYVTDGTTMDFAYGDLGVPGITVELGTDFFQDCATFTNAILPGNLAVLTYAAKAARAPYLEPSGPDPLSVTATPPVVTQGTPVTVTATLSDTRFSGANGTEPTQNVSAAWYWVDVLPWVNPGAGVPMQAADGAFDETSEDVTAQLDTTGIASGRHTIFVRGQDASGATGVEGAAFLDIQGGPGPGTIQGTITEAGSGTPLVATVTAGLSQTTSNGITGAYSMPVAPGTYVVAATSARHGQASLAGVQVAGGQTVTVDLALPVLVDHLAGQGLGAPNPNEVKVYTATGAATATDFMAYGATGWGVNVAAGDLDASAMHEIVTGPGPGPVFGPHVRAFASDGTPVSKVSFYAYGTLRYGVNPSTGLLDADALHEIATGAGPGPVFGPHVRGFDFDGVSITPLPGLSFYAYATLRYGVNVSPGGVDADARHEIVTGAGPGIMFGPHVRGFDYSGTSTTAIAGISFDAFPAPQYGVNVGSGDADDDGFAEIATTPGPGPAHAARFLGWNYDGAAIAALPGFDATPYTSLYGGRAGLGDVDLDARADLVAAPGRDPAAQANAITFGYDGTALIQIVAFSPFTTTYGANVATGALGL